jgi:rhomboid-like protein
VVESLVAAPFRRISAPLKSRNTFGVGVRTFVSRRIITKHEELPESYTDDQGLPFSAGPLRKEEVFAIFGKGTDANSANRLLSVLHGRRVAGTLADLDAPGSLDVYEERAWEIGLAWLRKNVPVDEIRSASINAENQLAAMKAELVADSERLGLYKPNSIPREKNDMYGKSVLDAVREQKEKELDEKEAREAREMNQANEIRQNTGTLEVATPRSRVELRRPGENPRLKFYLERSKVLPNTPPEMSMLQRLWPSGLIVVGVVLGCVVFSHVYRPPKRSDRLMPEIPPAAATFIGLFLVNLMIFGMWHHPPAFRLLNKYFVTTPGYPYPLSLVGNIFSHQSFSHFAMNMTVLYFVGTRFHDEVGRGNFLAIYVACGALGSFVSLASWVIKGNFVSSSLGASGALAGIIAAYLWLNSNEAVKFFGVFPPDSWPSIPSIVFLVLLIGSDMFCLTKWNKTPITLDHWAHLGGYAAGIGAAELLKMKARRRAMEEERRKNEAWVGRIRQGRV